jgi:hypothetical protein
VPSNTPVHPKAKCDVCGRMFSVLYMSEHRRKQHGIATRRSRKSSESASPSTSPSVLTAVTFRQSFTVMPFVVLEDEHGALWLAERVRDA